MALCLRVQFFWPTVYMCDYFNYRISTFIFILDSLCSMLILIITSGKAYVGIKPSIFICRVLFNHDSLLNDCLLASLDLPRFYIVLVLAGVVNYLIFFIFQLISTPFYIVLQGAFLLTSIDFSILC